MNQIPIEQAYREACTALGEAVIMQRLLAAELARLQSASPDETSHQPGPADDAVG